MRRNFKGFIAKGLILQPGFTCALWVNVDLCAKQLECNYEKTM